MSLPEIFRELPQGGMNDYIQYKNWYVRSDLLHLRGTERMHALRHLPGLHNAQLFILWHARKTGKRGTVSMPYAYDAFQINDGAFRLRAFDIAHDRTIKVVKRDSRYGAATERELQARTTFLKDSALRIPDIIAQDSGDSYIRFSEEMLTGRAFIGWLDSLRFMKDVGEPLLRLGESYGIAQKPLAESMDASRVAKIMRCPSSDEKIARARHLLEQNKMVNTTIAHCDLISSNMIVTNKGLYVVDWEKSAPMYAGYDFARLAVRYPRNPVFARAGRGAMARLQGGRMTLDDVRILRDAIMASHRYTV